MSCLPAYRPTGTAGEEMHQLAEALFPLHRSIAGKGVRQTFDILSQELPLKVTEVPTGTRVFDWTIPQEWDLRDAYIADRHGRRIVDYAESNLHVVNYSQPVEAQLSWRELRHHVHLAPGQPDCIPYRTAYFRDEWGFCVTAEQYQQLAAGGPWQVVIDARFHDGALSIGECEIPGESEQTVLFHCHTCHPSLANDNLSSIVVATQLAKHLRRLSPRFSYRFVFAPATIGAITWLALQSAARHAQIQHGLVLTLLGDSAPFTYKMSRSGTAVIDHLVPRVLSEAGLRHRVIPFSPSGYDERQYGSPGFNLPVGRLSRSTEAGFSEYHTSADNLEFVRPEYLAESLQACLAIVEALESAVFPVNRYPYGEPQLGRRGIFRAFGEHDDRGRLQEAMLWILNLGDGQHDLHAIAARSGMPLQEIEKAFAFLNDHGLVATQPPSNG